MLMYPPGKNNEGPSPQKLHYKNTLFKSLFNCGFESWSFEFWMRLIYANVFLHVGNNQDVTPACAPAHCSIHTL